MFQYPVETRIPPYLYTNYIIKDSYSQIYVILVWIRNGGKVRDSKNFKIYLIIILAFVLLFGKNLVLNNKLDDQGKAVENSEILENGKYYSKDQVALYLHKYKKLPSNYLTKLEAKKLGWDSSKGNLWDVTDKGVIGGDRFSNREGKLPSGKKYFEADVNYKGGFRGSDRLVYTKQGHVIYFTGDHYKNFEVLYE